jgi:SOS-response transcriptional repressor LexA
MTCPNAPLAPPERKLLALIAWHVTANGYQPSYREIAAMYGWKSIGYVQHLVARLARKGVVVPKGARALSFAWREYLDLDIGMQCVTPQKRKRAARRRA